MLVWFEVKVRFMVSGRIRDKFGVSVSVRVGDILGLDSWVGIEVGL